jgi:antitoxin component YwqK of YwqJK toxin-antitoxin module
MIKYYRSLTFDDHISEGEVSSVDNYVKAYIEGDKTIRAELVLSRKLDRVVYFNEESKRDEIYRAHKESYGNIVCEIHSAGDHPKASKRFVYDSNGLDFFVYEFFDENKNLIKEEKYSSSGELIENSVFRYNESGELLSIKDYKPDGSLIEETLFND